MVSSDRLAVTHASGLVAIGLHVMTGGGPKIAHNVGRRTVTNRQRPRKSKRTVTKHRDRYAEPLMSKRLAALVEHFASEERINEYR